MNTLALSIICVVIISTALLVYYFAFYRKRDVPIIHKEFFDDKSVCRTYYTLNGVMHGQELIYYPNHQLKSDMMWVKGEKNGLFTEYNENGTISCKGNYKDGKKVAQCFVYYPTGETNKEQIKINDVPDGPFTVYFKNGQPYIQGNYKKGVLNGEYTVYTIDGNVKLKKQY